MKYWRVFYSLCFAIALVAGVGFMSYTNQDTRVALAAEDAGGATETSTEASGPTENNDCTGGQCGAEIDTCSTSGSQCYSPQYCTEYNTPQFSSPLRVSAEVGQPFAYEVQVAQVNPNPTRRLNPWEHPQLREHSSFEAGWFGSNTTSLDPSGLVSSGLSPNMQSVVVQKKNGIEQVPNSTGLIISGVPTAPGMYSVTLTTRNDLEEWIYEAGGSDNQSSTFAGVSDDRYYKGRTPSCSRGDILQIEVNQCRSGAPVITSPERVDAQVGTPFSFQAAATGNTSLSMSTAALPEGTNWSGPLSVSGTPTVAGTYTFTINAENSCGGSATKNVTVVVAPLGACAAATPTITSAASISAPIGGSFPGYTIQTSGTATGYSITSLESDVSFPASLGVTNNGRSLEGSLSSAQSRQQYRFRAEAWNTLPDNIRCPSIRDVTINLSCPSDRPNWNPGNGQCTNQCTDQAANNYGQPGQCRYDAPARCNDPLALNAGALGACNYSPGRVLCTDPSAINFGLTGSCQPRTSCGAGESGTYPNCREIACPTCGVSKTCSVCVATDRDGNCTRHESRSANEIASAPNSCGMTRSLYYCPDENAPTPPPPPGEQACAQPVTVFMPERELIQKGTQCTIPWRVSAVPAEQAQFLRCVISGPDFSVRANGASGQVLTPFVNVQSLFNLVCRNGDAKVSNTAKFTCRVSPRFEER